MTLTDTIAKSSQNIFAYSFVSEHTFTSGHENLFVYFCGLKDFCVLNVQCKMTSQKKCIHVLAFETI